MSHTEEELRQLASWLPGLDDLKKIDAEIAVVWQRLRELRKQAARTKDDLVASCPLELDELEFRFWTKVAVIDDQDSCWEYTGARHPKPDNYGSFRWRHPVTGENVTSPSSVVSMFLTDGCLPANQGNHHCDNPPCSRPKHIYDGTHQENMRDRSVRGRDRGWTRGRKGFGVEAERSQAGSSNYRAKLTDDLVVRARDLARQGLMLNEVHTRIESPVSPTVLRWAITGRTWKHLDVTCPPVVKAQSGSAIKGKKVPHRPPASRMFTDDHIREIRRARDEADPSYEKVASLATRWGVSTGMISGIALRRLYAHVTDQETS